MKLIIEIPEEQYNDIVKHLTDNDGNYAYSDFNLREIIRNGTPYNPSGDCISREDLKKAIEEVEDNYDGYEPNDLGKFMSKVYDLIDNAQAIPLPSEQIAWEQGYEAGLAQGKHDRPQGEWIIIHTATGETKCKCNQCQHFIEIGNDKNYCPNCGADMRGEEDEKSD